MLRYDVPGFDIKEVGRGRHTLEMECQSTNKMVDPKRNFYLGELKVKVVRRLRTFIFSEYAYIAGDEKLCTGDALEHRGDVILPWPPGYPHARDRSASAHAEVRVPSPVRHSP